MRRLLLSALFCLFTAVTIQADPFTILPNGELVFNTSFTTQGTFICSACTSGTLTNSVVFGSGGNTVTLTFTGVNTTLQVGAQSQPTSLGTIQVTTTGSGFVFPVGGTGNVPVINLLVGINQTSPTAAGGGFNFFAFGGGTSLMFLSLGTDHTATPTGPNPPGFFYTFIVYTAQPFTVPNSNAVVNVNADISAVPEPASVLLLTSGVGMAFGFLKRHSARH